MLDRLLRPAPQKEYLYVMDLKHAEKQARALMAAHGVSHLTFKWNRGKNMMGAMHYHRVNGPHSISLSSYWVQAMTEEEVLNVMLHEIAHVFTWRDGHGWAFKSKCRELGTAARDRCYSPSPETKARMAELAPPLWVGSCRNGHTSKMHRAPLRVKACGKCSRVFSAANIITWERTDGRPAVMSAKYMAELNRQRMRSMAPMTDVLSAMGYK